jgi:hypothetical protein
MQMEHLVLAMVVMGLKTTLGLLLLVAVVEQK